MANQATGAIVAKKFAHAYEESERLAAELGMFERENAMLRDEIDRCLLVCCSHVLPLLQKNTALRFPPRPACAFLPRVIGLFSPVFWCSFVVAGVALLVRRSQSVELVHLL